MRYGKVMYAYKYHDVNTIKPAIDRVNLIIRAAYENGPRIEYMVAKRFRNLISKMYSKEYSKVYRGGICKEWLQFPQDFVQFIIHEMEVLGYTEEEFRDIRLKRIRSDEPWSPTNIIVQKKLSATYHE